MLNKKINNAKINLNFFTLTSVALAAGLIGSTLPAHAIDVDPGDWITAPAGTNMGLVYLQRANRTQAFAEGALLSKSAQLQSSVEVARYVYWTSMAGLPAALELVLPAAQLKTGGALSTMGNANGIGDLALIAPIWLLDNKSNRQAFAVVPYVYLPTGSYQKNSPLNVGENRMKYDLQFGYTHGIGEKFNIELTGDGMIYQKNYDAALSQAPLYQAQGYISYNWTPVTKFAVGTSYYYGGQTSINGVGQKDQIKTTNVKVTASTFITPSDQVLFTLGRDLSVYSGLKEDSRFNFRYLHIF